MIVFNLLAPHGALAQNLVLAFLLVVMFLLGYAIRDGRAARRERRRQRWDLRFAEHTYRKAREQADNEHLTPPTSQPEPAPVRFIGALAPDCSARAG